VCAQLARLYVALLHLHMYCQAGWLQHCWILSQALLVRAQLGGASSCVSGATTTTRDPKSGVCQLTAAAKHAQTPTPYAWHNCVQRQHLEARLDVYRSCCYMS
jgi:hypothetical protein